MFKNGRLLFVPDSDLTRASAANGHLRGKPDHVNSFIQELFCFTSLRCAFIRSVQYTHARSPRQWIRIRCNNPAPVTCSANIVLSSPGNLLLCLNPALKCPTVSCLYTTCIATCDVCTKISPTNSQIIVHVSTKSSLNQCSFCNKTAQLSQHPSPSHDLPASYLLHTPRK